MKAYTNKFIRTDSAVCLYGEIRKSKKAMKTALRFSVKQEIKKLTTC